MTIQGLRHTENFVTNQRPENWREGILRLYPNGKAPLLGLSSQMKSESTDDPVFHWWDKLLNARRVALTADITNVATTFTVGASSGVNNAVIAGFRNNHMLRLEHTGELVRISADPSPGGTTITVVRAMGSVVGTAITVASANPNMHVIGTGMPENSAPPIGVNYDPTERKNYTQIFRHSLTMSRTAQKTRLRTGDQVAEAKRECLEYHSIDMEWAAFFGEAPASLQLGANGEPMRFTNGVIRQISDGASSNIVDDNGANLTATLMETHLEQAFRYGSSEKVAFCGNAAILNIQKMVRLNTAYQIEVGVKEYGMNVMRLTSPFGDLILKTHPLFNQLTAVGANLAANDWLVILDMAEIKYRYLKDSDTQYQPDNAANGIDGMLSGYLTECGFELHHPLAHCVFKRLGPGTQG